MQTANSRSTLVPPTSKQPPKWSRGMSFSLDLSESKAPKVSDQKLSTKSSTSVKDEQMNLEKELRKSKESERTMLESLISQTKQFEQTKISLEEAKLEIRSLQEIIKCLEDTVHQRSTKNLDDKIGMVQIELKLAAEAEEKSKKAMDSLALALKEVSEEANQTKAKLRAAEEESMLLKLDLEDRIAALIEKEKGFRHCMKIWEEEKNKMMDSLRISREDNVKIRDILKHAVNEATVVKGALEIVRNENTRLEDLLSEKEIVVNGFLLDTSNMEPKRMVKLSSEKWEESLASEKQKKKTMFKRFGDILSKSSLHK